MVNDELKKGKKDLRNQFAPIIGVVLIISGSLFLLDQQLNTNWLSLALPVFISLILLVAGIISKRLPFLISGFICFSTSAAIFPIFQKFLNFDNKIILIGIGICIFSSSWLLLFMSLIVMRKTTEWWVLFVATISGAVGCNFFVTKMTFLNFMFSISMAIGIVFFLWALKRKQLGLLIPGLLISTIGAGVYFAWNNYMVTNGLQQTGTMLVWFAVGWILITITSKMFSKKFIWWPLIPGGVLAMVGSGLYIGGNPGNALGFFQNTGSIGLIMFGVYLILLKYGMNK